MISAVAISSRPRSPLSRPAPSAVPAFVEVAVTAADGVVIAARHFAATGPRARGAVLIVPAMGVPQSFYAAFASWLAGEGFDALTFDYRGMGLSRRGSLRGLGADIVTWGEQDTAAALRMLETLSPGTPVTWIGHSLGGQILPFVTDRGRVAKVITLATGSGYWRENAAPLRRKVWLLWFVAVPLATPLFGYFPGRRLGMVGDLPRNVIRQWRRWCLDPEYAVGAEGAAVRERFAAVTTPIVSFSFTDDDMMSAANITSIHGSFTRAPRTMHRLAPHDLGVAKVGHFGGFRPELREPLWNARILPELAR